MTPKNTNGYLWKYCVLITLLFSATLFANDGLKNSAPTPKAETAIRLRTAATAQHTQLSHQTHIHFIQKLGGTKNDCSDCHLINKSTGTFRLNEALCKRCHLTQRPSPSNPPGAARKLKEIKFDHQKHSPSKKYPKFDCMNCHKSTANDVHRENTLVLSPEKCFSCHTTEKVHLLEKNCSRCHQKETIRRTLPQSHKKNWMSRHGYQTKWQSDIKHGERCTLCHNNSACISCHRTQRPQNHNGLWRIRMHGTAAKWDRTRCKTCHETGACVSCHRRTAPTNHRGAWERNHGKTAGPGSDDRCAICHNPGWCIGCHSGGR